MRRPLNPADHFALMMDHELRRSGQAGNLCALAYELGGMPDMAELSARASRFADRFPLARARLVRRGTHYFWEDGPDEPIFTRHSGVDVRATIRALMAHDEAPERMAPVSFHIVDDGSRATLLLRWFHPIADAKGAELVMHHLIADAPPPPDEDDPMEALIRAQNLWRKAAMALKARGYIKQLDQRPSILPRRGGAPPGPLDHRLVRFDAGESEKILANALKLAGMTGTAHYFIGCTMRAIEAAGSGDGEAYCVPYAMNLRKRRALSPVFGNQLSFLFAQASRDEVSDRRRLFTALRDQARQTVRAGLDHAMIPLIQAGNFRPLDNFGRLVRRTPHGGERNSFWFSYTGEPDPPVDAVLGVPVEGSFQLSQVTDPPSLAVLVSQRAGQITLSLCTLPGALDEAWIDRAAAAVRDELLGAVG
ncbi:MAG: hypothetical protein U0359_27435 [Byssovorax sp.]